MDSTCESSSEDEEEKRRISDVVKALTFENQSDSDCRILNECNNKKSFLKFEKNKAKPSLRYNRDEEEDMMCLGTPQFRQHVGKKLMELIDSLYKYEEKISGKTSEKTTSSISSDHESSLGVRLFKSSGFINAEQPVSTDTPKRCSSTKVSRKTSQNTDSSSSDDEELKRIQQATVEGWDIIEAGRLKTSHASDSVADGSMKGASEGIDKANNKSNLSDLKPACEKSKKKKVTKTQKDDNNSVGLMNVEGDVLDFTEEAQSKKKKKKKDKKIEQEIQPLEKTNVSKQSSKSDNIYTKDTEQMQMGKCLKKKKRKKSNITELNSEKDCVHNVRSEKEMIGNDTNVEHEGGDLSHKQSKKKKHKKTKEKIELDTEQDKDKPVVGKEDQAVSKRIEKPCTTNESDTSQDRKSKKKHDDSESKNINQQKRSEGSVDENGFGAGEEGNILPKKCKKRKRKDKE